MFTPLKVIASQGASGNSSPSEASRVRFSWCPLLT